MKTMKNFLPGIASMIVMAILLAVDKLSPGETSLSSDMLFGVMLLLLCPVEEERWKPYLALAMVAFLLYLLPLLLPLYIIISTDNYRIVTVVVWMLADLALKTKADYGQIRKLFRNERVWKTLQDRSRLSLSLLTLALMLVGIALDKDKICLVALCCLFSLLFLRSVTGWSLIVSRKKERFIVSLIKGSFKCSSENDNLEADAQMNSLYNKIKKLMEEKELFLDETLSLESLSQHVGTNKLYLSRTINIMSGKNFRQFVNYYRVEYAMNLFRENPQAKIEDVSLKSGFHTLVTFDMAFRIVMDITPSEWLHKYRAGMLK